MANTFELISAVTLGSSSTSVSFSSIPQTFTDLKVLYSARCLESVSGPTMTISFNGSTSGVSTRFLSGDGSSASSAAIGTLMLVPSPSSGLDTANTFGSAEIVIPNYTGSTNKSSSADGVSENNATTAYAQLAANLWSNTAAITSITLSFGYPGTRSFVTNSTFYLYGVKNA